jgi:cob(I)alamin adenosyltransferase
LVKLNKIYTRTGDDGTTGLVTGERRPKDDLRFEAVGTVDELNAAIGLARLHADEAMGAALSRIQNDLFDLGAELATPAGDEPLPFEPLTVAPSQVDWLEARIDALNAELSPLRSFVLPAGSPLSSHLHLARTVARRAERVMVGLARKETVAAPALRYVNRLSDFLFVAARHANGRGEAEVLWVPGQNR